jgi:hypothetical protein
MTRRSDIVKIFAIAAVLAKVFSRITVWLAPKTSATSPASDTPRAAARWIFLHMARPIFGDSWQRDMLDSVSV